MTSDAVGLTAPSLADAAWRHSPTLLILLDVLGGSAMTRVVGGAVRDTLAGLPVSDIDLATRLMPQQVVERLKAAAIKAVPTGLAHGTVTAVVDGQPYEVTTLRRDVATDGRHATVAYTDDWSEDAARRDFTINALYADPVSGAVFDPTGGIADLSARRVRFIGDAGTRIDEDHLRILRWFRFMGRFGDAAPDPATLALITARALQLRGLSRERIADEMLRLLALPEPVATLRLMLDCGIFAAIGLPVDDRALDEVATLVANHQQVCLPVDPPLRLIALMPRDPLVADEIARKLKLSNRLRKRIAIAARVTDAATPASLAHRLGRTGAMDQIVLGRAGALSWATEVNDWQARRMPIGGGDLIALGMPAGPAIARLLQQLEDQWIAAGFPDAAIVRAMANRMVTDSGLAERS